MVKSAFNKIVDLNYYIIEMSLEPTLEHYRKGFCSIWLTIILAIFYLSGSILANVISVTGVINLDSNNDGSHEAQLNSDGLTIGANLAVGQNLEVLGNMALSTTTMTASGNLGDYSKVLVDSWSSDIRLYLPYAGNVTGRTYSIKIRRSNKLYLIAGPYSYVDNRSMIECLPEKCSFLRFRNFFKI